MSVKALIPAAGRGKRLAGVRGAAHKELLRVGPLTMIEHALTAVLDAGLTEVGVVVRPDKNEVALAAQRFWSSRRQGGAGLEIIHQPQPLGVAHAMLLAEDFAGGAPLAVVLPDNLIIGGPPPLRLMLKGFAAVSGAVCGAVRLTPGRAGLFGNVGRMELAPGPPGRPRQVLSMSPKKPGRLEPGGWGAFKGTTGGIYPPGWPDLARSAPVNHEGELDDTDIVLGLLKRGELYAVELEGEPFDLGNPDGLAAAREAWRRKESGEV